MRGARVGGQFFLELGHLRPKDVLAVRENAGDALLDAGADAVLLGGEINEGDHAETSVRDTRPARRA